MRSAAPAPALAVPEVRASWRLWSLVLSAWASFGYPFLLLDVGVLAVVLRVRHLTDIPRYADEINEITPAFDIVRGTSFPLMSGPKHIGALFDYILAGAMLVFGRSPDLPRTVVLIAGLLTVLVTYGYARSLGGRWAGLLAAGFLAVSAPHVLLSSRVAWSVSLTPLLAVGAAWTLDRAVSQRRPWYLLATGLLAGLALQAHPAFVVLLPAFAAFILLRGRHLFRQPALYLAGLLFLLGCSNVLLYNWQSNLGGARSVSQEYPDEALGSSAYVANLAAPTRGLLLTLGSAIDPSREQTLASPFVLGVAGLSIVALVALARRTTPLPLLAVGSALVLLPLLNNDFAPLLKARYAMPLVPLVFVAVGVMLARGLAMRTSWIRVAAVSISMALLAGQLGSLLQFEAVAIANNCTNAPQRDFVAELDRQLQPGEWILLDQGVLPSGERFGYLTLLELSSKKVGETSLGRGGVWEELRERPSFLTAVSDGKVSVVFEKQGLSLLPQQVAPVHPALREPGPDGKKPPQGIGLYRVSPEGAALLAYDAQPGCGDLRTN
jgi:4-amino-4-deoxy-L-arabinose transferase-like glycosyltransferase